ncbi:conserved hypothetical protein [Segniliparus rotundus DSM 44985]|uniref:Uncharacterized protein n=1 Tax=Segniliparus rotundus (strain ATCC BAA-972 / CDC 1076 / CIP 108378 / DSM 44985 / JCM 13578) TaxID=640132 RepID=D6Z7U0_SEGRD|nr:hypothetical protein [Segniliparus rotundus]ADG98020.1 conserved hypothetical protein [Segniliparus rotundus DSM 44985]
MTTPNLTQPVMIARVPWPAHKALAVLAAVVVLLGALVLTASHQLAFALSLTGGMLVWWTFAPRLPHIRSQ